MIPSGGFARILFDRKRIVFLSVICAVLFAASSCIRVRGPGLVPPIEEGLTGEWVVLSKEFSPSRPGYTEGRFRFTLTLLYSTAGGDRSLSKTDLCVLFDDDPVPFSFDEADQILETDVLAFFGPGLRHSLVIRPSEDPGISFPTLTLTLE